MAPSNRSSFTGTFKFNDSGEKEYNVTLDAWATVTGQSAVNLKTWVTETVLPTLPVFLDWLSVPKNNGKTGGFTRDTVVESMRVDFAFIKQSPEKFINSDRVTATTVQAHTAFIIRGHLMKITACTKHFNTTEEWNRGAFDFNKFLTKNMGDTRAFGKGKTATAEAARQKFVEDTQWRAADYLNGKFIPKTYSSSAAQPPVSTNPPPVDGNADASAESNIASSSKSIQALSSQVDGDGEGAETTVDAISSNSPTSDITLRVNCVTSGGEGVEKIQTRKHDCNFAAFKTWAIGVFKMTAKNERLSEVSIQIDVVGDDWKVTVTEQDWQLHIREACNKLSEGTTVNVSCLFDLVQGSRGSWIETDHFRDLYHNGHERSDLSVNSSGKPNAYLLFHHRSPQEASSLIESVVANTIKYVAVEKTPATKANAADLNFEAINPFDDEEDSFADSTPLAYDIVQSWLTIPKPSFEDVGRSKSLLRSQLGVDAEIVERLPPRMSEDPLRLDQQRAGDAHKPHQICFLHWSILMEFHYKAVFCCDGCGTGKTHEFISHIIGATQFWTRRGQAPTKPTLVVCPRTLLEKTYLDLKDQLGIDWEVYKYGQPAGVRRESLLFDPKHPTYKSTQAGHTVVVVTYNQLQNFEDGEKERVERDQLFLRIILDEAQCIRRCDQTRQGAILKSFNANYKAVFTGSPVVDSILDLDGYLAFLEFPLWSYAADLNISHRKEPIRSRYALFKASLDGTAKREHWNAAKDWDSDWDSDCESVDGLDENAIKVKIENGWNCTHWPAMLKYNRNRPSSLDRKARKKVDGRSTLIDVPPPFEDNPYDLYHTSNIDSLKCCSTKAFRYYVGRHVKKSNMDELDVRIVAISVQKILGMMVLSRNLFSKVIGEDGDLVSVASDLPPVKIFTQELRLSADELAAYQEREKACERQFAQDLEAAASAKRAANKDAKKPSINIGSKFAKLSALCTHIGFSGLEHMSTPQIRAQRKEGLPLLTARMKKAGALNPEDKDNPLNSDEEVLRQFLWGSPKMRFMLWEIQQVILGKTKPASHRKIMATFQFPRSAEMFLKLVGFVGVRAVLLDTNMSADERHKHIRAFDEKGNPQVLITTYALNIAGHDAQHRCATVAHVEPAFNRATEHQAASRVYRIGQEEEVEIVRLLTKETYQELHESSMIKKAKFPYHKGAYSRRAYDVVPDRLWTATAMDLKRKHPGNDAIPTLKQVEEVDTSSEGEHQIAAKRLWSDYVMRGGVSQAGVTLSEKEFMKKLPARFRKSKHPEMYCLEDFVYDLLPATETPVPSSQTTVTPFQ